MQNGNALQVYKNLICKICGISYPKRHFRVKGFCSEQCYVNGFGKQKKCKPFCNPKELFVRLVKFKNETHHAQECCNKCRRTKYVPRWRLSNLKEIPRQTE